MQETGLHLLGRTGASVLDEAEARFEVLREKSVDLARSTVESIFAPIVAPLEFADDILKGDGWIDSGERAARKAAEGAANFAYSPLKIAAELIQLLDPTTRIRTAGSPRKIPRHLEDLLLNPILDNFNGTVSASLGAELGTALQRAKDGTYEARPGQNLVLLVEFQPMAPSSSEPLSETPENARLQIQGGRNADRVAFDVELDSETVSLRDSRATLEVFSRADSRPSKLTFRVTAPRTPGEHAIWTQIFQKNRLIQVLTLTFSVDSRE